MTTEQPDLGTAICVYLKNYPGRNDQQFGEGFGDRAEELRERLREILAETIKKLTSIGQA